MGKAIFENEECFDADFLPKWYPKPLKLEQIPNSLANLLASPQFNNPINDKKDKQ